MAKNETSNSTSTGDRDLKVVLEKVSQDDLPELIAALSSERESVRSAATCFLMEFGEEAAGLLIDKMQSKEALGQSLYRDAVINIGGHAVLPLLLSIADTTRAGNGNDPEAYLKEVAKMIKSMPKEAVEALAGVLDHEDSLVAFSAAEILRSMGGKSKPVAVKIADSLRASMSIGHGDLVLIKKLKAMKSLGAMSPDAIKAMGDLLSGNGQDIEHTPELNELVLSQLGSAYEHQDYRSRALEALVAIVRSQGDPFVRREAIKTLNGLQGLFTLPDDNKAVLSLIEVAKAREPHIGKLVTDMLGKRVPEDAVSAFNGLSDLLNGASAKDKKSELAMLAGAA